MPIIRLMRPRPFNKGFSKVLEEFGMGRIQAFQAVNDIVLGRLFEFRIADRSSAVRFAEKARLYGAVLEWSEAGEGWVVRLCAPGAPYRQDLRKVLIEELGYAPDGLGRGILGPVKFGRIVEIAIDDKDEAIRAAVLIRGCGAMAYILWDENREHWRAESDVVNLTSRLE